MQQKQRAFFQLARAVPTTTWSAADPMTLRPGFKSVVFLLVGLWIFGMGHASLIVSGLGVSPWTTLAQGVSAQTGWSIGVCVLVVGVLVLMIWIPLRERPGMGTIANIIVVAIAIDVTIPMLPQPTGFAMAMAQSLLGIFLLAFGSALYLTANLGPGPRDGLMTGIQKRTNYPIGWVRTGLEITVLIVGWRLGGVVGIGTVMMAFGVGPLVAVCLSVVDRFGGVANERSDPG